jgi:hypothetical protein
MVRESFRHRASAPTRRRKLRRAGTPGGTLPAGDWAVQAIGTDAAWLASHAQTGARLSVTERLRNEQGQPVQLHPGLTVTSAGPILLQNGQPAIDAVAEGVLDPRDLNDYTFSAYRHARTMIGVDSQGRIVLATVDGIPGVSEGMTLTEEAALMRSLGRRHPALAGRARARRGRPLPAGPGTGAGRNILARRGRRGRHGP